MYPLDLLLFKLLSINYTATILAERKITNNSQPTKRIGTIIIFYG